jgi:hypothetical protein
MLSQNAKDDCFELYQRNPEELLRLANFGNDYQKAAARVIINVGVGKYKQ